MRNNVATGLTIRCVLFCVVISACTVAVADWPQWNDFSGRFVQDDGRVVDLTFGRKSTSEGQSYGLFFALVANERERFDAILRWTSENLAGGQLGERLPAWLWGQRDDSSWGVKDTNSAADADLWLAYTLLEAARLWREPRYAETGRKLLAQIRSQEIAEAGAAGPVLLPAPVGFRLDHARFRLDPSYMPGFIFNYLASADPQGPWGAMWRGYLRLAPALFATGVAPDLFVIDALGRPTPDTERTPCGSYDAIRVYLWAGMSGAGSEELLRLLAPYAILIRSHGGPPEKADPVTGGALTSGFSPLGFSGAVLPFLSALGDRQSLEKQRRRLWIARVRAKLGGSTNYYDQALILFGEAWIEGRYRFDDQGRLDPAWAH